VYRLLEHILVEMMMTTTMMMMMMMILQMNKYVLISSLQKEK
jgi:hypothetical protein